MVRHQLADASQGFVRCVFGREQRQAAYAFIVIREFRVPLGRGLFLAFAIDETGFEKSHDSPLFFLRLIRRFNFNAQRQKHLSQILALNVALAVQEIGNAGLGDPGAAHKFVLR